MTFIEFIFEMKTFLQEKGKGELNNEFEKIIFNKCHNLKILNPLANFKLQHIFSFELKQNKKTKTKIKLAAFYRISVFIRKILNEKSSKKN